MWEPIIIPVRTASQRIQSKPLLRLGDTRSMLSHVLLRCLEFQFRPIVATTCMQEDDEVWSIATGMNIACTRGPLNDVLKRMSYTVDQHDVKDRFAVVHVDQPFFDPGIVRALYKAIDTCDVALPDSSFYRGTCEVAMSVDALQSSTSEREELVDVETSWRDLNPELNVTHVSTLNVSRHEANINLDVDSAPDYWLANMVMKVLGPSCQRSEIIEFFERNPDLSRLNT